MHLPILELHLDEDCFRIVTALQLGAPVCESHLCRCSRQVDSLGHHIGSLVSTVKAGFLVMPTLMI